MTLSNANKVLRYLELIDQLQIIGLKQIEGGDSFSCEYKQLLSSLSIYNRQSVIVQ